MVEFYLDIKVFCSDCGWLGTYGECPYGHNAYCCPSCGSETLIVIPELESNYPVFDEKSDEVYKP